MKQRVKKISTQKLKEIEKSFSALKTYYDHDDAKYIWIRDAGNLCNQSNDKDYYKPIKTKSALNNNYVEYKNNEDKDKILSAKKDLNMIIRYLSNIINDRKAFEKLKVYLGDDDVSYYKT